MTKEQAPTPRQRATVAMLDRAADSLLKSFAALIAAAELAAPGEFRKLTAARAERDAERAAKRIARQQAKAAKPRKEKTKR